MAEGRGGVVRELHLRRQVSYVSQFLRHLLFDLLDVCNFSPHLKYARFCTWFLLVLSFLVQAPSSANEGSSPFPCNSIREVLANKESCHGQPVRLSGNIVKLELSKRQTRFSLSKDSKPLKFFNKGDPFGDMPIKVGDCVVVEGVYYFQSTKVSTINFKDEVQWFRVIPCAPTVLKKEVAATKQSDDGRKQKDTPIWIWFAIGCALLLIVTAAIRSPYNQSRYRRMGKEFEEYVARLFDSKGWVIEDRSSDTSHTIGRTIIGDLAYDWVLRHRQTGKRFIVQCKYRSRYYRDGIEWAKPYQIRNYQSYQRVKGWEYLVILGVGGEPSEPEHLYLISLKQLKTPFVGARELQPFLRISRTPFTLNSNGIPT